MALIQKAIKVGTSVAVVIPKASLKILGIKSGMDLSVDVDEKNQRLIVSHSRQKTDTKELLDWNATFTRRYKKALDALASK